MINFLADHNNIEDAVYKFCKQHNIDIGWDFDKQTRECWNEISFEGICIFQIQQGITEEQFLIMINTLWENYEVEEIKDDGKEYWLWRTPIKELFIRFIQHYKSVFNLLTV